MPNEIIEKVKKGLEGIEIGYFDTGQSFEEDAYYNYFGASDKETRRYAIAVFTVYLGNWYSGCSFPFLDKESYLEEFIKAFVERHQQIESDFPIMYEYIISFLIGIEEENSGKYAYSTIEIDNELYKRLKEEVLIPKRDYLNKHTSIKYFLRELRVNPFFISDYFEE
ncbi:hypothetical protein CSV71_10475 [Sporosarcina sp. P21c]|uniref:hypothetical protein n=1 Tax=unclassified Sporosarcina TaxID=2647733 RepID=UPI000C166A3B|nr:MULTISPECIES: hypothetical protein [unclassified Sporosarcina]PIC67616.1 hypothetical protein CSV78_06840 [Sporosarcina sp. P16a]PIC89338.1 hypothetical protein CSV71_10475 [Sporosarcina sp. P21c]PIC93067.1 hypothetical protein CSV70_07590 [Sporosarcina sp. P25]